LLPDDRRRAANALFNRALTRFDNAASIRAAYTVSGGKGAVSRAIHAKFLEFVGRVRPAMTGFAGKRAGASPKPGAAGSAASVGWLIAAGLLLVGGTLIAAATVVGQFRQHEFSDVERELTNTALLAAMDVDQQLGELTLLEQSIARRVNTGGVAPGKDLQLQMSGDDVRQMLKTELDALPEIDAVEVVNRDGTVLNSTRSAVAGFLHEADVSALQSFSGATYIGKPERDPVDGIWKLVVARKLVASGGEFAGAVVGPINLDHFQKFFDFTSSGTDRSFALFRDDGMLLLRSPRIEASIGGIYRLGLDALGNADSGVWRLVGKMDGKDRVLAAHRLAHFPLFVTVGIEEHAIASDWRKQAGFPVAAACLMAIAIVLIIARIVRQRSREHRLSEENLALQKERLDTAINNMGLGLLLFDANGEIVACNHRFAEMYGLSREVTTAGCTIRDLIAHRKETGSFEGDIDAYCASLFQSVAQGKAFEISAKTPNGRSIKIVNQPLPSGGWVATHEDVTERQLAETERDRNRKFLDLIIESVPVPVFVKNADDRRYVLVNRAAEEFWGISRHEIIGQTAYAMFPQGDGDLVRTRDDESIRCGGLLDSEREIRTPRNGKRLAAVTRLPIADDDGQVKYLIGVIGDNTERRRLERERDRNLAFLTAIIEAVPVTIVVKEAGTMRYTLVNRAAEKLWGLGRDKVVGRVAHEIFPKATADKINARDIKLFKNRDEVFDGTHEIETPGNGMRMVRSKKIIIAGDNDEPQYLLGVVEDVTESARASERIKYMAHHDLLTGLSNRTLFMEKIAETISHLRGRADSFAVFMLDLDRFKEVNDSLGHAAGDELLKEAARRLRESVRDTDVLARLGDDEFALIQRSTKNAKHHADTLAKRIIEIFGEPFDIENNHVTVGVSIGISLAQIDGDDPSELMKKADLALYRAKSEGRNGFCFFDARLATEAEARHHLERDLRLAIFNNELEVHYQPIVKAATGIPCAVEALARWRHPKTGFVPPQQFIPLAEETGLIAALGEQILHKACTAAANWPADIKVAVNLSALQFRKPNLVDMVTRTLAEAKLPADRLELEITETVLIDQHLDVLRIIRQLKALGVSIVLDDFGTGYSSLSYLTMFPFDKIKIDKYFTQNLTRRAECGAIVSAVRALAYSLNIEVVAEGVETRQQFEMLRAAGITGLQGYLFGKPCALADLRFDKLDGGRTTKKTA
jgi:diguanylate cyclase (GGDEF)-like protein/PAS domain S-box-containing protein